MNDDLKRVITGKVRLSYVNLLTPRALKQGDKLKYSATLLIPKADIATKQRIDAAINAAIQEGVTSKWNGSFSLQPAIPLYDGDGVRPKGDYFSPECKGHWVLTAASDLKPQIIDLNMKDIINPTEIYSGMYARVSIRFFPYFNSEKKGIGCVLGNVQKLQDGEPLGGRTNAVDDFGGYTSQLFQPILQAYPPQQPAYPPLQQPVYNQQPMFIDPITGAPINGGVMGI